MIQDSKLMNLFSTIVDLLVLNVLFIITSLPIVTMGASLTALYSMTLKMVRDEESHIIKGYFRAFKNSFFLSTKSFLVFLVLSLLMIANIVIAFGQSAIYFLLIQMASTVFLCIIGIYSIFFFPVLARFDFTFKQILIHISHMIITHISMFLLIIALNVPFVFLGIFSVHTALFTIIFFLIIGVSLLAYIQSFIFRKIFEDYER